MAFFTSGTAAVASGIQAALASSDTSDPEVIVPGYSSPDIINAVRFAGARPVPVDFEPDRPWIDPAEVAARVTDRTVAVVAVRLLGLPERIGQIREALGGRPIRILYDCCHSRPGGQVCDEPDADYLIFSFGRGKQISFLGGGALLRNTNRGLPPLDHPAPARPRRGASLRHRAKVAAHNTLLHPRFFGTLDHWKVPGVRGRSARPLGSTGPMPAHLLRMVRRWTDRGFGFGPRAPDVARIVAELPEDQFQDLPALCDHDSSHGLIRYPLLMRNRSARDGCLRDLTERGLGASRLYSELIADLSGMPLTEGERERLENAQSFCDRLLTIPVHSFVSDRHLDEIASCLTGHVQVAEVQPA